MHRRLAQIDESIGPLSLAVRQRRSSGGSGTETMIREADDLACQSWNERMWADGEAIDRAFADER
jgi:hypothetical protein